VAVDVPDAPGTSEDVVVVLVLVVALPPVAVGPPAAGPCPSAAVEHPAARSRHRAVAVPGSKGRMGAECRSA
jgi:hypothetical protein